VRLGVRTKRAGVGIGVSASVGAVLLLALPGFASAGFTFSATAPFGPYGGLADLGRHVGSATGTGSNGIVGSHSFSLSSGAVNQQQNSNSSNGSLFDITVWSGVHNLTFVCPPGTCSGNYTTKIIWNASYNVRLASNCPAGSLSFFARVHLILFAQVKDVTAHPGVIVGSGSTIVYQHSLLLPAIFSASHLFQTFRIVFATPLVAGHTYKILTYIEATTTAQSTRTATGAGCSSSAGVVAGGPNDPTHLTLVQVG
jgi:hypothetical protein